MKQFAYPILALALSACTLSPGSLGLSPNAAAALDASASNGLSADVAAKPSVELAAPAAFALTSASRPFVTTLDRFVSPQRRSLAAALAADADIQAGLAGWSGLRTAARLTVLEAVAASTATTMGASAPPVSVQSRAGESSSVMAYFENDGSALGHIVLYQETIAAAGAEIAVATVVHETRHAVQYQLMNKTARSADEETLADGYAAAWQAIHQIGDESSLSYGDYAHLTIEFDAFQTGNAVAEQLFGTRFDPTGLGFVDTQTDAQGAWKVDLLQLGAGLADAQLIAAVNRAQAQAMASAPGHGGGPTAPMPNFGRYRPGAGRAWR